MRLLSRRAEVPEQRDAPIEENQASMARLIELVQDLKDQNGRVSETLDRLSFFFIASDLQGLDETKFEAIGGIQGVKRAVNLLYSRVMTDPDLAPYFGRSDLGRVQQRQVEMFLAIFGIREYRGVRLGVVHASLGITNSHFSKLVSYIVDVLDLMGLDESEQQNFVDNLEAYRKEIVTSLEGIPA